MIGPSGAGKSSFLRAGLLPTLTDGWQAIITTPGSHPFGHLARALAGELGEAPGVTDLLQHIDEPDIAIELLSEWRRKSKHALLIVDQFEELFTQNLEGVQASFAELLGRLPLEADLFVLLSMRDDFLFHCQSFEPLAPVFSELAPLGPPIGASLRRALVEPALRCGYRFEEESIVEEMLAEVEGERGALPMVAFTAERLWTKRDREAGLLTKAAYETMGGVGGALAQHAEATLTQIGEERSGIVRELFRRTSLELSYVKKDNANIMEDTCNGNLTNPEADAACDYFVLANLEGVRSNYEALILRFESRARDWFHVVGSYVYSDLQGNHDGGYETSDAFDVWPYFFVNRYGYLPDHSRHRVKVNGFVILPLDFSLALNSWWRSEFRWTPEIWPDAAPWGTMYLEPRGSRSEPGEYQIDFQVAKGFTWGRTRLQLIGTVYNLLSTETATEACTLETGCGTFEMGDPIAWQLPRRYELGVRLEF